MKYLNRLSAAIGLLMLAGCFQVETVVRVNPDGSGTVMETMMLSSEMISQMNEMMQNFAGENGTKPPPMELYEPDKLKAQAAGMGEGVTYLSGEKAETEGFSGYKAAYAFEDINRLRLNPVKKGAERDGAWNAQPVSVIFHFSKGPPATLTIEQPMGDKAEQVAASNKEEPARQRTDSGTTLDREAKELVEMFKGMRIAMAVEVNGAIAETNATHRDGNRITIVDFDLAKFGSSLPEMEKLERLETSSPAEAMELIKAIPGMKVDLNDRVKVVFR